MPEMTRIDSSLSLPLIEIRNESFRANCSLRFAALWELPQGRYAPLFFYRGPQCNFRLFIVFRASLGEGMDSETRATSQARLPRSIRRYCKLAPRGHVSPRVANYFSRFTLRKYYVVRFVCYPFGMCIFIYKSLIFHDILICSMLKQKVVSLFEKLIIYL